jgi:hypothetical protein
VSNLINDFFHDRWLVVKGGEQTGKTALLMSVADYYAGNDIAVTYVTDNEVRAQCAKKKYESLGYSIDSVNFASARPFSVVASRAPVFIFDLDNPKVIDTTEGDLVALALMRSKVYTNLFIATNFDWPLDKKEPSTEEKKKNTDNEGRFDVGRLGCIKPLISNEELRKAIEKTTLSLMPKTNGFGHELPNLDDDTRSILASHLLKLMKEEARRSTKLITGEDNES